MLKVTRKKQKRKRRNPEKDDVEEGNLSGRPIHVGQMTSKGDLIELKSSDDMHQ